MVTRKKVLFWGFLVMASCVPAAAMAVTLLYPNGNESLDSGMSATVRWQTSPGEVSHELKYSTNGGKQWKKIAKGLAGDSYSWPVPLLKTNARDCRILVIAYDASRKKVSEDRSDESFAIDVVGVTSPAPQDTLTPGATHTITWTTTPALSSVGQVLLKYSLSMGKKWTPIAAVEGNPGSYDWKVPWMGAAFSDCKVMVELKSEKGKTIAQGVNDEAIFIGYTPEACSGQLVNRFGEDDGFDAIVLAFDRGYSLPQILEAIVNDRIATDGIITDASGIVKKPEDAPTNYFVTPVSMQGTKLRQTGLADSKSETLTHFKAMCIYVGGSIGKGAIILILDLLAKGYTIAQINEAIFADETCFKDTLCKLWGKEWSSKTQCEDGSHKWLVKARSIDIDCHFTGNINFHNCPGGGRAYYDFNGISQFDLSAFQLCKEVTEPDGTISKEPVPPAGKPREGVFVTKMQEVTASKNWGAGDLGDNAPETLTFKIREGYPPNPNFAP
jgi:hypothetical protein